MKKLHATNGGVTFTPVVLLFGSFCCIAEPFVNTLIPVVELVVSTLPNVESVERKGVVPATGRFV